jgi:hypothetical protein
VLPSGWPCAWRSTSSCTSTCGCPATCKRRGHVRHGLDTGVSSTKSAKLFLCGLTQECPARRARSHCSREAIVRTRCTSAHMHVIEIHLSQA